jgi:riboflavin kinase/FMN adenylyltransferase
MQLIQFRERPDTDQSVLTMGNFDGVHLGHQALIRRVLEDARRHGSRAALLTFNPHPQSVLLAHRVPILTNLPMRLRLFEQLGLDAVAVIPFTQELSQLSAEAFVEQYIFPNFKVKGMVIGYDFAFGRNREGTAAVMEKFSREHGFFFDVFPAVDFGEDIVSSTRIREALNAAQFDLVRGLLDRPYSVLGPVVKGLRRGHELGFPTLNLVPEDPLPLTYGVYAVRTIVSGQTHPGVANYGVKPTVGTSVPTLEVHLFGFDREAYGETAEVIPVARLREERKFESLAQLKAQIARDSERARELLEAAPA